MVKIKDDASSSEEGLLAVELFSWGLGKVAGFERVDSLGVTSDWGNMELLPGYAPSILMLKPGIVRIRYKGGGSRKVWEYFALKEGVMTIDAKGKAVILSHEIVRSGDVSEDDELMALEQLSPYFGDGAEYMWHEALLELSRLPD